MMMSGSFQPSERGVVDQACDDGAVATGKQKRDGGFEGWKLEVFQVVLPNLHPKCKKPKWDREGEAEGEKFRYMREIEMYNILVSPLTGMICTQWLTAKKTYSGTL